MVLDWLKDIIADDDLGLLDIKKRSSTPTSDEHLISKFNEINEFIEKNNREPEANVNNVPEYMLNQRLNSIRGNQTQSKQLLAFDEYELLPDYEDMVAEEHAEYVAAEKTINSIEDIFADDDHGLLEDDSENIFNLKHVTKERAESDQIARRKPCKNFKQYEKLFKHVHAEIRDGKRKLLAFNDRGENLIEGGYYILGGVLLFVESIDISSPEKTIKGKRFRKDGRTRTIFENGTESNLLYRSLAKALYNDGKIESDTNEDLNSNFYRNMGGVSDEDQESGFIYILTSQNKNPEISNINNLHKIGYSTVPIEQRIANAENEATYLMAPVNLVASYQCFNMNAQKFEALLHNFFGDACLDIQIADKNGKLVKPREWFIAPIDVIDDAIDLLVSGEIVNYQYDSIREKVFEK